MPKTIVSEYQGFAVSFTDDGWFNATAAADRFSKSPHDWLRLPATQDYLAALTRKYGGISYLKTKRGKTGGTWLHPKLAVRFAQWLDIDFAIWCDEQIDSIIRETNDWQKLRSASASSHKVMAEVLRIARQDEGKETKAHHYSNEARLVNWALTGEFGAVDRSALSVGDLALLASLEERNSVLIGRNAPYASRKLILEQHAIDWRSTHRPALHLVPTQPQEAAR
jgi:hypothetical protein